MSIYNLTTYEMVARARKSHDAQFQLNSPHGVIVQNINGELKQIAMSRTEPEKLPFYLSLFSPINKWTELPKPDLLSEAVASGKRIKHKDWGRYCTAPEVMATLSNYSTTQLQKALSDKVWYTEP